MKKVLIVTGSQNGSTFEIGKRIQPILENKGYIVDCISAQPQKLDIADYDLIVIGSGIYGGVPHKTIKPFIDNNRTELSEKDIAIFAVCGKMAAKSKKQNSQALPYIDSVACGLNAVLKTAFAGKIPSYGIANFILRLAIGAWPGDHRDWNMIENWADTLSEIVETAKKY